MSNGAHDKGDSPFWRFSLGFYASEGVAPACLALQDAAGVDVNLLLFLLFLAREGKTVTESDVARLDAAVAGWRREVVQPLRDVRRRLKSGAGEVPASESELLRLAVKRAELDSEHIEQSVLEGFASKIGTGGSSPTDAAARNLEALGGFCGPLQTKEIQILIAAFTAALPSARSS